MLELTTVKSLRETVAQWRAAGESVALVPTMGALHHGHLELVKAAQKHAQRVIVSIFVNPTQFGPNEDFSRYPRPLEEDLAAVGMAKGDAVWLPTVAEMYPDGFATSVHVKGLSEVLEGAHRPGHFDGVATVVAKLLLQVAPDVALFGQKDYQQLCVIKRMVADLNIPVEIIGVPTVRVADGLALSSRNRYLSEAERAIAPKLHAVLMKAKSAIMAPVEAGDAGQAVGSFQWAVDALLAAGFSKVDYLAYCDGASLEPLTQYRAGGRLLVAAWLGKTRLIDNIRVE